MLVRVTVSLSWLVEILLGDLTARKNALGILNQRNPSFGQLVEGMVFLFEPAKGNVFKVVLGKANNVDKKKLRAQPQTAMC